MIMMVMMNQRMLISLMLIMDECDDDIDDDINCDDNNDDIGNEDDNTVV